MERLRPEGLRGLRTNQTLTIAYRNGTFIVAGVAYDHYDYMKDDTEITCDYNVLTGKGMSSKKQPNVGTRHMTVSVKGQTIAFRDWNPGVAFTACGDLQ